MAGVALTEKSSGLTEFSGNYKMAYRDVDGAIGSTGYISFDEFTTVVAVVAQLSQAPTADCAYVRASINSTTGNQVDCILYEDDHVTVCTQNPTDFYLMALGY